MKKIFKYLVVFLALFCAVRVKGEIKDYMIKNYIEIPGVYVTALGESKNTYNYLNVIVRASDKQYVYCIEPGTKIEDNTSYNGVNNDYALAANMTAADWERVSYWRIMVMDILILVTIIPIIFGMQLRNL